MHLSKKNEFKILIFIMALIITFGLAMGGNYLHARYNIESCWPRLRTFPV